MKIRFLNIKLSTITALSMYLFSQVALASINNKVQSSAAVPVEQAQIVKEISAGLAELLTDIGIYDVLPQAHKQLRHSVTEEHAAASLKQATDQLPEYKFKVVITE